MPELPEVEHVRLGLLDEHLAAPVTRVWRSPFDLRTGAHWAKAREHTAWLRGATPGALRRRGKFILWDFSGHEPGVELSALIHLGMTGRCVVNRVGESREAHTHISLSFADGRRFDFIDPRRFGGFVVDHVQRLMAREPLVSLGPEPLGELFSATQLRARAGTSRRVIRQALLDQKVVAGLGNIYVSEALFVARIPPLARCTRLRAPAWSRLADAIVEVLTDSIARGGTTLRDYRRPDGSRGGNQHALRAYGRADEPCVRCETALVAHTCQGRSGVHCPRCQAHGPGGWVS